MKIYFDCFIFVILPCFMQVPDNVQTYKMLTSVIWMEDGIVFSTPIANPPLISTDEEIIADVKRFKEIIGNQKAYIIVEANSKVPAPPKHQRDLISEQLNSVVKALAVIHTSAISKMIANLFFALKPPAYPTKNFTHVEDAKAWIKELG